MRVEYTARNYDLDDRVRNFAESKLQKLDKFLQEPAEARLTIEAKKHRHRADLRLSHRFGVIRATEVADEMLDAIHLAVDKAEKQARRSSKKFIDKRRKSGRDETPAWPVDVLDADTLGGGEGAPKVIKSSRLTIQFMSVEEAASHLQDSKNEFVVFRNLDTDQVNVLYRRRDDNFGLISPEL